MSKMWMIGSYDFSESDQGMVPHSAIYSSKDVAVKHCRKKAQDACKPGCTTTEEEYNDTLSVLVLKDGMNEVEFNVYSVDVTEE